MLDKLFKKVYNVSRIGDKVQFKKRRYSMKNLIKVMVVNEKGMEVVEIPNDIDKFYEIIGCRCIDIATRRIGEKKKYYDIIVDDEGLLVDNPRVSAIDSNLKAMLVGNLIITNYNDEGETTTLTNEDIAYLSQYVEKLFNFRTYEYQWLLTEVNY